MTRQGLRRCSSGQIDRRRAEGKINNLEKALEQDNLQGTIGIGHTRWATHGSPTTKNAHPHATQKVAVVHNGIIENYTTIKKELSDKGYVFETETDTEVVVQLITAYLDEGLNPQEAANKALR